MRHGQATARSPGIAMTPPSIGPAPRAPRALGAALALLDPYVETRRRALANELGAQAGHPLLEAASEARRVVTAFEVLETGMSRFFGDALRGQFRRVVESMIGADLLDLTRARAEGLIASELDEWALNARAALPYEACCTLLEYAEACRTWERALDTTIGSGLVDPDWDMASARGVAPHAQEAQLGHRLEERGVEVQSQVGVSQVGGARSGGWFAAYWLDCAHRDVGFLLKIDIELDGMAHRQEERHERDALRDALLAERGWYIVRIEYASARPDGYQRACTAIAALARRHRRAIMLGRTDAGALARYFQAAG